MASKKAGSETTVVSWPDVLAVTGSLRNHYLKEQHPLLCSELLLSGELYSHLLEIDEACEARMDLLILRMAKLEGVTEALKADNQMEWVRRMNSISSRAEEIVLSNLVYLQLSKQLHRALRNPGEIPSGLELVYEVGWQNILAGGLAGESIIATNCVSSGSLTIMLESEQNNTALIADLLRGAIQTSGEEGKTGSTAASTLEVIE